MMSTIHRRFAFYKQLSSYVLANEVEKFLATKFGKFDATDFRLGMLVVDAFASANTDMAKSEREKMFAALFLSNISQFFESRTPLHFLRVLEALYHDNASRLLEMDLLIQLRSLCIRRLARLFAIDFFDFDLREKIIKLIDDDKDELDSNQDYEYSDESFYDDICELVRSHDRFKENSLFQEVLENLIDPTNQLIGMLNQFKKRKLNMSDISDSSNRGGPSTPSKEKAPLKKLRLSESTTNTISAQQSTQTPRKSRSQEANFDENKENRSRSPLIELMMDQNKSNHEEVTDRRGNRSKSPTKRSLATANAENTPTQSLKKLSLSPRKSPRSLSPVKSCVKITRRSKESELDLPTLNGLSSADEGVAGNNENHKEDVAKKVRLTKKALLDKNLAMCGSSDEEDLDFGETSMDKQREKERILNALKKKPVVGKNAPKTSRQAANDYDDDHDDYDEDDSDFEPTTKKKNVRKEIKSDSDCEKLDGGDSEDEYDKVKKSNTPAKKSSTLTIAQRQQQAKKPPTRPANSDNDISELELDDDDDDDDAKRSKNKKVVNIKSKKKSHINTRTKWSDQESLFLVVGIELYGKGKWAYILSKYESKFVGRTSVDLKDRYRTLAKSGDLHRYEKEARIYINSHKTS